jgi:hypothetical protein
MDLCETDATSALVWIDAYLDASIFRRYLRDVQPQVRVTLVTSEPKAGKHDKGRWAEFLDVSRLYAHEHDQAHYRLVVHRDSLHDRWILFDGKRLYGLGGSAKDAGNKQYFTLARLDGSPENLKVIQDHVDTGIEYFGPNTPHHR